LRKEFISEVYQINSVEISLLLYDIIFFHLTHSHSRSLKPHGKTALCNFITFITTFNTPFSRSEAWLRWIYRRLFHDLPPPLLYYVYGKGMDQSVWLSFARSQEETLAFSAGADDGNVIKMYFLECDPTPLKNETLCPPLSLVPYRVRTSHRVQEAKDKCTFFEAGTCAIEMGRQASSLFTRVIIHRCNAAIGQNVERRGICVSGSSMDQAHRSSPASNSRILWGRLTISWFPSMEISRWFSRL